MFVIYGGGNEFNQWEQGKMLINEHMTAGDRAIFRNAGGKTIPVNARLEGNTVVVDVPNDLLMNRRPIVVDLDGRPSCRTRFDVIQCDCPAGYTPFQNIPDPTPATSWNDLKDKPFYTEVDEDGNETVHKLDAKYLPIEYDVIIEVDEHFEEATGSQVHKAFNVIRGSYAELKAKIEARKPITGYISVARDQIEFTEYRTFNVTHAGWFGDGNVVEIVAGLGTYYDAMGYTVILCEDGTIE